MKAVSKTVSERGAWAQRLAILSVLLGAGGAAAPTVAPLVGQVAGRPVEVPALAAFAAFVLGGAVGLSSSLAGLVAALRGGTIRGMRAFFLGAVPAAILVAAAWGGRGYPRINDVTTDLADPPA